MTDRPTDPTAQVALHRAFLELGRLELAAAQVLEPATWRGTTWEGLGPEYRRVMLRRASDRLGLGLTWPAPTLADADADAVIPLPPPRPGMRVYLEGDDHPYTVRSVEPSMKDPEAWRAVFLDGSFLDPWPDLVDDVGEPWPPFATTAELAEIEGRRATDAEDAGDLAAALDRLGPPVLVLSDAQGRRVDPSQIQPGDVIAVELVKALAPTAAELLAELDRARGVHGLQHGLPDLGTRHGPRYWKDERAILEDRARTGLREEPARWSPTPPGAGPPPPAGTALAPPCSWTTTPPAGSRPWTRPR